MKSCNMVSRLFRGILWAVPTATSKAWWHRLRRCRRRLCQACGYKNFKEGGRGRPPYHEMVFVGRPSRPPFPKTKEQNSKLVSLRAHVHVLPVGVVAGVGPFLGEAHAQPFGGPVDPARHLPGVEFVHGVPVVLAEGAADGVGGPSTTPVKLKSLRSRASPRRWLEVGAWWPW